MARYPLDYNGYSSFNLLNEITVPAERPEKEPEKNHGNKTNRNEYQMTI